MQRPHFTEEASEVQGERRPQIPGPRRRRPSGAHVQPWGGRGVAPDHSTRPLPKRRAAERLPQGPIQPRGDLGVSPRSEVALRKIGQRKEKAACLRPGSDATTRWHSFAEFVDFVSFICNPGAWTPGVFSRLHEVRGTCVSMWACAYVGVRISVCTNVVYALVCLCLCVHLCSCVYTHTCAHTCAPVFVCMSACAYMLM